MFKLIIFVVQLTPFQWPNFTKLTLPCRKLDHSIFSSIRKLGNILCLRDSLLRDVSHKSALFAKSLIAFGSEKVKQFGEAARVL